MEAVMKQEPVPQFANVTLQQAALDGAQTIELSLIDASSETGLRVSYTVRGQAQEFPRAPGSLFGPAVVVLCNYAFIPYSRSGHVRGQFATSRPAATWLLESDDLKTRIMVSKT